LLVEDAARAKDLWRTLGRPGAVLVDGEIAGTWRARKAGSAVGVRVELWAPEARGLRARIAEQAERLAAFRQTTVKTLDIVGH
jgi:hypothetical protein